MELQEVITRETANDQGRVFLYVDERVLRAYELSAYILSKCFPKFSLREEVDRMHAQIVYCMCVDISFLEEQESFFLLVHDDFIEMVMPQSIIDQIAGWIVEFNNLKNRRSIIIPGCSIRS